MLIMPEHRHEVLATALLTIFTVRLGCSTRDASRASARTTPETARV